MKQGIAFNRIGIAMLCRALTTNTNLQSLSLEVGFFCHILNFAIWFAYFGQSGVCFYSWTWNCALRSGKQQKPHKIEYLGSECSRFKSISKILM